MKITVEMLKSWNACYWVFDDSRAEKCEAALPATPLQIAKAEWVSVEDRLWVLLREPVFTPKELRELKRDFARRAASSYANAAASASAYASAFASAYAKERRAQLDLVIAKLEKLK